MEGILIAVEGIDGAGKTTQVNLLAEALEQAGEAVHVSKEPTNGKWGQLIRDSAKRGRMALDEEIEAFRQDRIEHVETVIRPALAAGKIVILDRYFYSNIAYQGARGADLETLWEASRFAPLPDVVFLLDIHPDRSLLRISTSRGETPNLFENGPELRRAREIFLQIAEEQPRLTVLDASRSIDEMQRTIAHELLDGVLKAKRCAKQYGCDDPTHCIPRLTKTCRWVDLHAILPQQQDAPALVRRAEA